MRHATLVFLLLAGVANAAEHKLKNGIVVSDAVAIPRLPDCVQAMSPSEYHDWALSENAAALAAVPKSEDHVRYVYVNESNATTTTRYGGGVGYGGFGGSGGYAGYLGMMDNASGGGYGLGGFASTRPGNAVSTTNSGASKSYQMEFHSWPGFKNGGLWVLNPYCKPKR